ncbi:MAG: hypothetical protein ACRERC_05520 [Candidatus Binatia bacterium]
MRRMMQVMAVGLAVAIGATAQAATYTVTDTGNAGMGTLRQAILDANANAGVVDLIDFDLPGPSFTIQPTAALPQITDPVTIDGYTQAGASPNTLSSFLGGGGTNALPLVEIDGSLAGDTDGLLIEHLTNLGAGTTIRGLTINNFDSNLRAGIRINDDGNNLIEGNFIGTDVSGLLARPNFDGIAIELLAAGNQIGGTTPAARNLISGNSNRGLSLNTNDNVIEGNLIGTDRTSVVGLGNSAGMVLFNFAANNTIGGLGIFSQASNTISGNLAGGVIIGTNSNGHDILGNRIGPGGDGLTLLGNGLSSGVQVGGNSTTIINNHIAGNSGGIFIGAVTGTVVQANLIGLPGSGNSGNGILMFDSVDSLIGGTIPDGNTIAGNDFAGISIVRSMTTADGNAILTNSISSNGGPGIELINGANNNQPAPLLTSASGANRVIGTLNAAPMVTYVIQFFANANCDPAGGEGEEFIGSLTAATDGTGLLAIDQTLGATPGRPIITATATDPDNNTSQFSNCVLNRSAVVAPAPALDTAALAAALLLLVGIGGVAIGRRPAG